MKKKGNIGRVLNLFCMFLKFGCLTFGGGWSIIAQIQQEYVQKRGWLTDEELLDYTEKHFCDKENGEWYGYLHYDGTPSTTLKGNIFKGPFHIPRFLMIMAIMDDTNSIIDFMK